METYPVDQDQICMALQLLWREKHDALKLTTPNQRVHAHLSAACNAYCNAIGRVLKGLSGTYFDGVDWLKARGETEPFQ